MTLLGMIEFKGDITAGMGLSVGTSNLNSLSFYAVLAKLKA
jgi:hypothetical protein